jgi:phosphate:Na+ symporter
LQLVRFEDLFCLVSGAIMVALFYTETLLGVPLVRAAITWMSSDLKTQLALAFLLSNLLPAVVISIFQGRCQALLAWFWPATDEEEEARPKFINSHALADPDIAVDLLEREIARLLRGVRGLLTDTGAAKAVTEHVGALGQLAESIDAFAMQLAAQAPAPATAHRLNLLREILAFVRYLKENTHQFCQSLIALGEHPAAGPAVERLVGTATHLLDQAVRAVNTLDPKAIDALRQDAKYRGTLVGNVQEYCWDQGASLDAPARVALLQAVDDVRMIAAFLHHLAKLLADLVSEPTVSSSEFGLARRGVTAGQGAGNEKG